MKKEGQVRFYRSRILDVQSALVQSHSMNGKSLIKPPKKAR